MKAAGVIVVSLSLLLSIAAIAMHFREPTAPEEITVADLAKALGYSWKRIEYPEGQPEEHAWYNVVCSRDGTYDTGGGANFGHPEYVFYKKEGDDLHFALLSTYGTLRGKVEGVFTDCRSSTFGIDGGTVKIGDPIVITGKDGCSRPPNFENGDVAVAVVSRPVDDK